MFTVHAGGFCTYMSPYACLQMSVASTVNALNVKHLLAHLRPVSPPAAVCAGQRCLG